MRVRREPNRSWRAGGGRASWPAVGASLRRMTSAWRSMRAPKPEWRRPPPLRTRAHEGTSRGEPKLRPKTSCRGPGGGVAGSTPQRAAPARVAPPVGCRGAAGAGTQLPGCSWRCTRRLWHLVQNLLGHAQVDGRGVEPVARLADGRAGRVRRERELPEEGLADALGDARVRRLALALRVEEGGAAVERRLLRLRGLLGGLPCRPRGGRGDCVAGERRWPETGYMHAHSPLFHAHFLTRSTGTSPEESPCWGFCLCPCGCVLFGAPPVPASKSAGGERSSAVHTYAVRIRAQTHKALRIRP